MRIHPPMKQPLQHNASRIPRFMTTALHFGSQDRLDRSQMLAPYPSLSQYVLKGKPEDTTPLTQRNWSHADLKAELKQEVQRENFNYHCPEPIPFAYITAYLAGLWRLINPLAPQQLKQDDGRFEETLIINANEKAFEYGVRRPMAFIKQGQFEPALESYSVALNAAPARRIETYETLGNLCEMLDRFQRNVKAGYDNFADELKEWSDGWDLNSSLSANVVVPEKGKQSKMAYLSSVSGLITAYTIEKQPIKWETLRHNLRNTTIPFRKLAQEAYQKASDLSPEINVKIDLGDIGEYREKNQHKTKLSAMAQWMGGHYDQAIHTFKTLLFEDPRGLNARPSEIKPLGRALYEAGRLDEALDVWGKLLNNVYSGNRYKEHYTEFLTICTAKAKQDSTGKTSAWDVALPYLERGVKETDKADGNRRHASDKLPHLFLAQAYEALGQNGKAAQHYQTVTDILIDHRQFRRPGIPLEPWEKEADELLAAVQENITRLNKPSV